MQTFLPYPDFARSARALDRKRLGKQRVETLQVVRALTRTDYGWQNHPAVLMWRGCEEALGRYGLECCAAWTDLGFDDTCALSIVTDLRAAGVASLRTQDDLAAAGAAAISSCCGGAGDAGRTSSTVDSGSAGGP
ncbi:MSMEG_6728 family protein, partial [uncultured Nocardioides sp.]|uniref:MSMEG_6728 family protein n=1 Tax=uncultured Nocardioides sp. TaxID=198441 RepID=UPI00261869A4